MPILIISLYVKLHTTNAARRSYVNHHCRWERQPRFSYPNYLWNLWKLLFQMNENICDLTVGISSRMKIASSFALFCSLGLRWFCWNVMEKLTGMDYVPCYLTLHVSRRIGLWGRDSVLSCQLIVKKDTLLGPEGGCGLWAGHRGWFSSTTSRLYPGSH